MILTSPVCAGQAISGPKSGFAKCTTVQRAAVPLFAGWSFGKLFSPFRQVLGDKRRMIQFATIGMCIGLYIMMRK
jgi:hypothetical protein